MSNSPLLDVTDLKVVALNEAVFLCWTEPEGIEEIEIEWSRFDETAGQQTAENTDETDKTAAEGKEVVRIDCSDRNDLFGHWSNCSEDEEETVPLENGVAYTFTIRTIDEDENGSKGVSIKATPQENANLPIDFVAAESDQSVRLGWSLPKGIPFRNKKIDYAEVGGDDEIKTIPLDEDSETSYTVEKLSNGKKYSFTFSAEIYRKSYRSQPVFATPVYFATNPDTERAVAIKCDGKVFLSWTYKKRNIFGKDLTLPEGVNVYTNDVCTGKILPISTNETVNPDTEANVVDRCDYKEYYTYTVDAEKYSSLKFCAVNEAGVESNSFELPAAVEVSLPIVAITTENLVPIGEGWESSKKEEKISSTLSLFNCDAEKKLEAVALTVKGRGNSSWENAPKKSYTLKFKDKQGILGMKKHKSWALVANYFDKTLLRNVTAYELGRMVYDNMAWTPSAKSVHLFMNGIYEGIYAFTETNKIDTNRVNIKNLEDYAQDGGDFYDYGYLLEANDRADENFNFETNQYATKTKKLVFSLKEPDGEDISKELCEKIKEEVLKREAALFAEDFADEKSENYWKNYFHEDSFIDWWMVSEFACNTDSNYFSSCYVYSEPKDDKLHAGPLWDFDLGFGNMRDLADSERTYTSDGVWLKRMFEDASFKEKARARWNEKLPALRDYLSGRYTENLAAVKKDVGLNFKRWPILGEPTWKSPSDADTRKDYGAEVEYFKSWCSAREAWLTEWLGK